MIVMEFRTLPRRVSYTDAAAQAIDVNCINLIGCVAEFAQTIARKSLKLKLIFRWPLEKNRSGL